MQCDVLICHSIIHICTQIHSLFSSVAASPLEDPTGKLQEIGIWGKNCCKFNILPPTCIFCTCTERERIAMATHGYTHIHIASTLLNQKQGNGQSLLLLYEPSHTIVQFYSCREVQWEYCSVWRNTCIAQGNRICLINYGSKIYFEILWLKVVLKYSAFQQNCANLHGWLEDLLWSN